jgi:hypothetical protein
MTRPATWSSEWMGPPAFISVAVGGVVSSGEVGTDWQHFAITFDGALYRLYLDGAQHDTEDVVSLSYVSEAYRIGCGFSSGAETQLFVGALDDLRLYNRVLAADEVTALAAM